MISDRKQNETGERLIECTVKQLHDIIQKQVDERMKMMKFSGARKVKNQREEIPHEIHLSTPVFTPGNNVLQVRYDHDQ